MAYIEIVSKHVASSAQEFSADDLRQIGEFTRENVARFLNTCRNGPFCFAENPFADLCVYGWEDFHAVCGDIDISWATEQARRSFEKAYKAAGRLKC